jgi:predicted enzyme related to lactoylglutathione lyase
MASVLAGITTSIDGYIAGPDDGPGKGLGEGGERSHYSSSPVSDAISEPKGYGFVQHNASSDGIGIPGGVGGGSGYDTQTIFYVSVSDVEAALQRAEHLGGTRRLGPEQSPSGLVIGHFTDPEGNLIGVAGLA